MLFCRECKTEMSLLSVGDDPKKGYAFNIYQCDSCDTLCKHDVWDNSGFTWILTNGEVVVERDAKIAL